MFFIWIKNKVWGGRKFHTLLNRLPNIFRFPCCQTEENVFLDHRPHDNKLIISECKRAGFENKKKSMHTSKSTNTVMNHFPPNLTGILSESSDERLQRLMCSWQPQNVPPVSSCWSEDLAVITAFYREALWQLGLTGSERFVNDNNGGWLRAN